MTDLYTQAVDLHKVNIGKLDVFSRVKVNDKHDLSLVYTPGVAQVCREIVNDPDKGFELTWRGRTVGIVSDGSAVLGLGNIGALAGLPVMEGKALILSRFAGVTAVPLMMDVHAEEEIVQLVKAVAPTYGAINLEDIAAPICFAVEDALQDIGIPVFHDDQHGTAIVVAAALRNAAKLVGKKYEELNVVISGSGAAGIGIAQLLLGLDRVNGQFIQQKRLSKVRNIILVDSKGIVNKSRTDLNRYKLALARISNKNGKSGDLIEAMRGADVLIGVSKGGIVTSEMVAHMANNAIVLAMANPDPEIMPEDAKKGGARIVGTGRSDLANQINNSLAFPGIFKGALEARAKRITIAMQIAASEALSSFGNPTENAILPDMFESKLVDIIASAVKGAYVQ
ncbi:MAG: NADP-dependent malic enzyme [bacterium]